MTSSPAPTTPVTMAEWCLSRSPLFEKRYGADAARDLILATSRDDEDAARRVFAVLCPQFKLTVEEKGDAIVAIGVHEQWPDLPVTMALPLRSMTAARAIIRLAAFLHSGFADDGDEIEGKGEILYLSRAATQDGQTVYQLVDCVTDTVVATHKKPHWTTAMAQIFSAFPHLGTAYRKSVEDLRVAAAAFEASTLVPLMASYDKIWGQIETETKAWRLANLVGFDPFEV